MWNIHKGMHFPQEVSTPVSPIYRPVWFTIYQGFSTSALSTFWTRYVFVVSTIPGLYLQVMVTDIPPPVVTTKLAFRQGQMSPRGKLCSRARTTVPCRMGVWGMLASIEQQWKMFVLDLNFSSFGLPFWTIYATLHIILKCHYSLFWIASLPIIALIIIAHTCLSFLLSSNHFCCQDKFQTCQHKTFLWSLWSFSLQSRHLPFSHR